MTPVIVAQWRPVCCFLAFASAVLPAGLVAAQTDLPDVSVVARRKPTPAATPARRATAPVRPTIRPRPAPETQPPATDFGPTTAQAPASDAAPVTATTRAVDATRARLAPRAGANSYQFDEKAIEALPQGANTTLDRILLQAPGVTLDSSVNGGIHIRNEHANAQYRVNGILLPEGVAGFGQFLDANFLRSVSLVTGALPAQYGLRTSGLIDVVTKTGLTSREGSVGIYGGSHATVSTTGQYSGSTPDGWEYFAGGRLRADRLGLENPAPTREAIHDRSRQGSYFLYAAKSIDPDTRVTILSGAAVNKFQIPNLPLQQPQFTAFGLSLFDSARLNQNQVESGVYNVAALQKTVGDLDTQLALFSRYSSVRFSPDLVGDLMFNGVASRVRQTSLVNGVQGDAAWRVLPDHTIRFGFLGSVERTKSVASNVVFPLDDAGDPVDAAYGLSQNSAKTGWSFSTYVQDEWRITSQLTLNLGLRFDQIAQYVSANQLSPRASLVWKPFEETKLHIGYARYFTPPPQLLAAPGAPLLYLNTSMQPELFASSPVRPERSHYFDAGIEQRILPGLDVGISVYYKRATSLLDDGQFGAALVLQAFNYNTAYNTGVELKAKYENGNFRAWANLAWARQRAKLVTSNQFLFEADEYQWLAGHYAYTDHAQTWTGSAGASYLWNGTRFSADLVYGSGLRAGFANTLHMSPYAQVNAGVSREFQIPGAGPLTLRFDAVNLFDRIYQIRDGSGIGVFAPQYGPRRAFYAGVSQKF
ncbi:MAG: TonB-dependent receptor [Beijerinckiaceae bacterium]